MYNIKATEVQIQRTLHFMVPFLHQETALPAVSPCWKPYGFFSVAILWVELPCGAQWGASTDSIMRWGRGAEKVRMPGSACCLKLIDVETSGLASALQPGSNARKAHCAAAEKPRALSCVYSPQCKTADTPPRITQQLLSPKTPDKIRWRQSQTIPFPSPRPLWSCLPISHTASAEVR